MLRLGQQSLSEVHPLVQFAELGLLSSEVRLHRGQG